MNFPTLPGPTRTRPVFAAEQRPKTGLKINKTKINFWFDLVLLILVLATLASAFIDIPTHKWLGLSMAAAVSVHLALHWAWIRAISQRFLKRMPLQMRLKAIINVLLLIVFMLLTMSGIIVSSIYAPAVTRFHNICFYVFISLILLHAVLNWKWIASNVKRKLTK